MRHLLTFALILVFAGTAVAADLGSTQAPKDPTHVFQNLASDTREGGETIETAMPIDALPFYDTGATCDNLHDYDEVCPYTGSEAPDVVYSFMADADIFIDIDLFGSLYDTKVFVYENAYTPGAPYACNDDFYSDYTSLIEAMAVYTGNTYYIVIDGWSGACGDYVLNIGENTPPEPCDLVCDGMPEGEPELNPDYVDAYNSGCNGLDFGAPFQDLGADMYGNLTFCGISGWMFDGSRDTDWFTVTLGATGTASWTVEAEQESYFFILGPQDCGSVDVLDLYLVAPCEPTVVTLTGAPGELIWLWAGPSDYYFPPGFVGNEYDYIMTFTGLQEGVVATDNSSWGSVKSMYR